MAFNTSPGRAEYIATAAQTKFTFTFKIYDTSDVKVYLTPAGQTPNDTTDILIETTDYTITINGDNGGDVDLVVGATLSDSITLVRELPTTRTTEYQANGDLTASALNADQDYQTYLILDGTLSISRSISVPNSIQGLNTILPTPEASKMLIFNQDASGIDLIDPSTSGLFTYSFIVSSMNELRLVSSTIYGSVIVKGYYSQNNGGGGLFNWDATANKSTANAVTIIDPSVSLALQGTGTGLGCWKRQNVSYIDASFAGAIGDGADCWAEVVLAKSVAIAIGVPLKFSAINGNNIFYISGVASPDLSGVPLIFDKDVELSVDNISFVSYKDWELTTDVKIYIRSRTCYINLSPNYQNNLGLIAANGGGQYDVGMTSATPIDFTTWQQRAFVDLTNSISWSVATSATSVTASKVTYGINSISGAWDGIFGTPIIGNTYQAAIKADGNGSASAAIGIILQCGDEVIYMRINDNKTNSPIAQLRKTIAGSFSNLTSEIAMPSRAYGFQTVASPSIGVRLVTANKFEFYINGFYVATAESTSGSNIESIGFAINTNADSVSGAEISNGVYTSSRSLTKGTKLKIATIGDSITYGAGQNIPYTVLLSHTLKSHGYADVIVDNTIAYPGDTAADQATDVALFDFSTYDYATILIGTNDIQSQTAIASFRTSVESIITKIQTDGCVPILGIPPMFSAQGVTGTGFATQNYALGALYRTELMRIAAENNLYIADGMSDLGEVGAAPTQLFDNLHPNDLGSVQLAKSFVKAILSYDNSGRDVDYIGKSGSAIVGGKRHEWRTSLPSYGYYEIGDVIWKTNASVTSFTSADVIVLGWYRVTTGITNVEGTDWHPLEIANRTIQVAITQPTGGITIDAEARTAINSIITVLQNAGLTS